MIFCAGCGKKIGEVCKDGVLIAYKGRAIHVSRETEHDVHLTITCERKTCGKKNFICLEQCKKEKKSGS